MAHEPGVEYGELEFVQTCFACPEQYDVYTKDGDKVGFVHLRNGSFTVYDANQSQLLYSASPRDSDGIFTHPERELYLNLAADAIVENEAGLDYSDGDSAIGGVDNDFYYTY